jgi:hypothetical protein
VGADGSEPGSAHGAAQDEGDDDGVVGVAQDRDEVGDDVHCRRGVVGGEDGADQVLGEDQRERDPAPLASFSAR